VRLAVGHEDDDVIDQAGGPHCANQPPGLLAALLRLFHSEGIDGLVQKISASVE
jgi:hypothetical protein